MYCTVGTGRRLQQTVFFYFWRRRRCRVRAPQSARRAAAAGAAVMGGTAGADVAMIGVACAALFGARAPKACARAGD